MGRRINEVIAKLPKERRKRILKQANEISKEMVAYADSLRVVRKALDKTQSRIGEDLGLSQNAVSQLESRTDLLLSTLRRYVKALGADLDIVVRMKDGSSVFLEGLGQPSDSQRAKASRRARKTVGRRGRASEPRPTP